jgi:hypothetical protein
MGGVNFNLIPSVTEVPDEIKTLQRHVAEGKHDLFESMLRDSIKRDREEKAVEAKNKDEKTSAAASNTHTMNYLLQYSLSASFEASEKEQKEKNITRSKNDFVMKQIKKAYGDL